MLNGKIVILQVLGGLSMGGAESRIMDILRRLDRQQFQYDFLLNEPPAFFDEEAERLGCRIFRTVKYKVYNKARYLKEMREFFSAHPEIDIVQGHSTNTAGLYLPIARECGVKCTMAHARSAGVDPGLGGMIKKSLRRGLAKKADICLACSHEAAEAVFGKEAEVRIFPNAVSLDGFSPTASHVAAGKELKKRLGLSNAFIVGHVGRFHYAKNHEFLLKIFSEIKKREKNAMLLLVGEGELMEQTRQQAEKLGIRESVIFAGRQADPESYYQAMDVLVFPSHYEGLPGTVVEAQASGLPVLMSEAVTKDVRVTALVECLSLKEEAALWAERALKLAERFPADKRAGELKYTGAMKEAGFDVNTQVLTLEALYREALR
ncbi:MAG: glycosyltransferase family 1 protein [Lachnospiraceae bacterium]|nr:glycosyltransferase family 1 protein [Lachnospiraceae bacterium]